MGKNSLSPSGENKSKSLVMIYQPPKDPKNGQHGLRGRDGEGRTRNFPGISNMKFCLHGKRSRKSSLSNALCPRHQWRPQPRTLVQTPFSNFSTIYLHVPFGRLLFPLPLEVIEIAFFSIQSTCNLLPRFSLVC